MKNIKELEKFNSLCATSKLAICGMPLRIDSYKNCAFGCKYCFAINRVVMTAVNKELDFGIGNVSQLEKQMARVFNKGDIRNITDLLLKLGYTLHWGGMSDPFQPCEKEYKITKQMLDICHKYGRHVVFSTKGSSVYDCNIDPKYDSFQLSVTNLNSHHWLEPGVAKIEERYKFYKELKSQGFKVGIRIQPFIPGIADPEIIEIFNDADYFTIEGLKVVAGSKEQSEFVYDTLKVPREYFKQMGLLNMKPQIRQKLYKPFIEKLIKYKIPFSISDNDLRDLSIVDYEGYNKYGEKDIYKWIKEPLKNGHFGGKCCCGDPLIHKSTDFNTTAMIKKYGLTYTKEDVFKEMGKTILNQPCSELFYKDGGHPGSSIEIFYDERFKAPNSIYSPAYQYHYKGVQSLFDMLLTEEQQKDEE